MEDNLYCYSVMGAKVTTHNGATFYGYAVKEVQTALNEMLVEGQEFEDPEFRSGINWAYKRLREKLCLDDQNIL